MNVRRLLVCLLAAWLPLAAIASANASLMMLTMPAPASSSALHADAAAHPACHSMPQEATADGADSSLCCQNGACYCNCNAPALALSGQLTAYLAPPPASIASLALPAVPCAPSTHPFRPPIA